MKVTWTNFKTYFNQIALALIICLLIFGEFRRNFAVAEIKQNQMLSRSMLNARAQIQIILINSTLEGRTLNATEIDRIKVLWHKAEYDQADEPKQ